MTAIAQNVQNMTQSTVDGLAMSITSDNIICSNMDFHTGAYFIRKEQSDKRNIIIYYIKTTRVIDILCYNVCIEKKIRSKK